MKRPPNKRDRENQLRGVGKILDILWTNSYYSMGEKASDRIRTEMEFYFGKNWTKTMYEFMDDGAQIPTIKELSK